MYCSFCLKSVGTILVYVSLVRIVQKAVSLANVNNFVRSFLCILETKHTGLILSQQKSSFLNDFLL